MRFVINFLISYFVIAHIFLTKGVCTGISCAVEKPKLSGFFDLSEESDMDGNPKATHLCGSQKKTTLRNNHKRHHHQLVKCTPLPPTHPKLPTTPSPRSERKKGCAERGFSQPQNR